MTVFVPLDATVHADLKFKPLDDLSDIRDQHLIPIDASEIIQLGRLYPVVLGRPNGENYQLCILCSLGEEAENVSITPEGKWRGPHVPNFIKQGPFNILVSKDGQRVVCVDLNSAQLGTDGVPLFDEGKPTKFLNQMSVLLNKLYESKVKTNKILDLLNDLELIHPLEIKVIGSSGNEESLEGIFHIDDKKLSECDDETWLKLKNNDAIALTYTHLFSLGHIQALANVLKIRNQISDRGDIEMFSDNGSDSLNFDNL